MWRRTRDGRAHRRPARSFLLVALCMLLPACAGRGNRPTVSAATDVSTAQFRHDQVVEGDADRQILVTVKLKSPWRVGRAGSSTGSYAIGYRTSARTERLVSELAESYELREVSSWPIRPLGVHCVVFEIPAGADGEQLVGRMTSDARIESVQPMNLFEVKAHAYNDPYVDLQHGLSSMQVQEAHRWARGAGVRIAVVDTGVDVDHPELRGHIRVAKDFVSDGDAELTPDLHGTAVTGVIASTVDNGIGIIGVAPAAQILALKACWQERDNSPLGRCNSFTLAKALTFAIEHQPDIVNLSLAGPSDPLLERLMRAALDRGIVVVAAASDLPSQSFPSHIEGVLSVRSAERADGDSGAIPTARHLLAAPGTDILTTSPAGGFDFLSGDSLATAHVSGVAALLLERQPKLNSAQLFSLLRDTSDPHEPAPNDRPAMVNACAAVSRVVQGSGCPPSR